MAESHAFPRASVMVDADAFLSAEEFVVMELEEVGAAFRRMCQDLLDGNVDAVRALPFTSRIRLRPPRDSRPHIPPEVRARIRERSDGRCTVCRSSRRIQIDHVIPYSRGGPSDESNLQALCRRCNLRKQARTMVEWRGNS